MPKPDLKTVDPKSIPIDTVKSAVTDNTFTKAVSTSQNAPALSKCCFLIYQADEAAKPPSVWHVQVQMPDGQRADLICDDVNPGDTVAEVSRYYLAALKQLGFS